MCSHCYLPGVLALGAVAAFLRDLDYPWWFPALVLLQVYSPLDRPLQFLSLDIIVSPPHLFVHIISHSLTVSYTGFGFAFKTIAGQNGDSNDDVLAGSRWLNSNVV